MRLIDGNRELEREGQAKKDHRYRPLQIRQAPPQISRQQVPVRCSKGCPRPTDLVLVNALIVEGDGNRHDTGLIDV